jgi:hypothetical protein
MILFAWSVYLSSADLYQDQVMFATGRGEALPLRCTTADLELQPGNRGKKAGLRPPAKLEPVAPWPQIVANSSSSI